MAVGKALLLARSALPVHSYRPHLEAAAIVGVLVFAAALFGIATRSAGVLAAVWPANAALLGAMVRWPHLATPAGWVAAVAGYVIADLLTGVSFVATLLLTVANLAGVAAGYYLLMRLDPLDRRLQSPMSVFRLVVIAAIAAAATGIVGAITSSLILGRAPSMELVYWCVSELVSYIALLPVVLTIPAGITERLFDRWQLLGQWRLPDFTQIDPVHIAPAAALVLSCGAALYIGGPGALAFPVTALLWCGLTYSVFATAVLALLFGTWTLVSIALGWVSDWPEIDAQYALISIRLAVTLMFLAPIIVAGVMTARNDLLYRLELLVSHDELTGLLSRRAFMEQSQQVLSAAAQARVPVAVLMLDIDHFKKINDTYGHGVGDLAMAIFASVARAGLREQDLIGRLGGEEIAILMAGRTPAEAAEVAERIRHTFAATPIELGDGRRVEATASIGLACAAEAPWSVEPLLQAADAALSLAKGGGRNRTVRRDVTMPRTPPPLPGAAGVRG